MRKYPVVSIIIPVYNCEKYIERCINSCIFQDFNEQFEIIVCDDKSTDSTVDIIEGLYGKVPELSLIKHSVNQGIGISRNSCIRAARGRYIFLLDGDDYIHPKTLSIMYDAVELVPTAKVVFCDYIYVDDLEQKSSQVCAKEVPIACGKLLSKFVYVQHGLYSDVKIGEEREYQSRITKAGVKSLHIPLPLYRYRQHELSITQKFKESRDYDN